MLLARLQVLEILSHVNKRIKGHEAIQLPLQELLQLALDPQSAPLVRNFGLVYAEMACDRAPLQSSLQSVRRCPVLLIFHTYAVISWRHKHNCCWR